MQKEIKKGKSNFEALVKKEARLLDIAKYWYLIKLGELGAKNITTDGDSTTTHSKLNWIGFNWILL